MNDYVNDFNQSTKQYFLELKDFKPYTKDEEKMLFTEIKKGNIEARNKLLTANLKFVFDIAKKYKGHGVPLLELISEGNMGLIKALEKFDTKYDVKFYCYGVWWIKQSIQDYIKHRQLNLTNEVSDEINDAKVNQSGCYDEEDEIVTKRDVIESNEDEENEKMLLHEKKKYIHEILNVLDDREKIIIKEYFGFNGKPKNLTDIAQMLNITMERVRQIKYNAIQKLRCESLTNNNRANIYI